MPERYVETILKYLADQAGRPVKPRQLARQLGVADEEYGAFRQAVKRLGDVGRIVLGSGEALTLPAMTSRVTGTFRANRKGFGFVVPDSPNTHGDLFIPPDNIGGAMTGDTVVARAAKRGKRRGQMLYEGRIEQILKRGQNRFVGTLRQAQANWFVLPDGRSAAPPIVVADVSAAGPKDGDKVVVEILRYAEPGELPTGVIVEALGRAGPTETETLAVIRAYGLADEFSPAALAEARSAVEAFDPEARDGREDITDLTVVTIDPPDARDFDDAVSLQPGDDGHVTLGVHIADVAHFVPAGSTLDAEARLRSTSAYFPRKVLPMLPEILSNGVCSLQEGQDRFCKTVWITYDADGCVTGRRLAQTLIRSTRRLTYEQAQCICDGARGGFDAEVVQLVQSLRDLSRRIEARRRAAGMLHLELPEMELVFDENNRLVDVVPGDDAYTHTMIEMFMVEANEAVAGLFDRLDRPILRRIHPPPDQAGTEQLAGFVRAAGHKIPRSPARKDIQDLLEAVKGTPASHAVNLAVLKTFQQAEYSPRSVEHYALAGRHYCHFTSPIRRYPDLTVHRMVADYCRGALAARPPEDIPALVALGEHCTAAEQRAENAEREVREVLLLQFLSGKVGQTFDGVIVGVTSFGVFVELSRYGAEGLIRMEDLGDDWWDVSPRYGTVRGERTGRTFRIGDVLTVRIAAVDLARRQMNLTPAGQAGGDSKRKAKTSKQRRPGRRRAGGR